MNGTATKLIAANVRAEVARRGDNRTEFAQRMGWSESSTRRRLEGVQAMSVDMLASVAVELGVPLSTLLAGVENTEANVA